MSGMVLGSKNPKRFVHEKIGFIPNCGTVPCRECQLHIFTEQFSGDTCPLMLFLTGKKTEPLKMRPELIQEDLERWRQLRERVK